MSDIATLPAIDEGAATLLADLQGPTLPFLVWRQARAMLSDGDPGGDLYIWLETNGYDIDPTQFGSTVAAMRGGDLRWWTGHYDLFGADGTSHRLDIAADGHVKFDGKSIPAPSFANRNLTFQTADPAASVALTFRDPFDGLAHPPTFQDSDTPDNVVGGLSSLTDMVASGAIPRQECSGEIALATAAAAVQATPVKLAGRQGTYTPEGLAAATGDPLETWNGVYTIYVGGGSGFVTSPVRLTVAAAAGAAVQGLGGATAITLDAPVPDNAVGYADDVLSWPTPPTPATNQLRFFVDATGLRRFSGTLALGGVPAATAWGELARPLKQPAKLEVLTAKLPDAISGSAYAAVLEAGGATGTVAWSIVDGLGNLPEGLSLSGDRITGTPAQSGVSAFVVQAALGTGTAAVTVQKPMTLTVLAADTAKGQYDVAIASAVAAFIGGVATPVVLWLITMKMDAKARGKDDVKLKPMQDAATRVADVLEKSASTATTDSQALTGALSSLKTTIDAQRNAYASDKTSLDDLGKQIGGLAGQLADDAKARAAEVKQLQDKIKNEQDAARKQLLEDQERAARDTLDMLQQLKDRVTRMEEENAAERKRNDDADASDGKAASVADTMGK